MKKCSNKSHRGPSNYKSAWHFLFLIFDIITFDTIGYPLLLVILSPLGFSVYVFSKCPLASLIQSPSVSLTDFLLLYSFQKSPQTLTLALSFSHALSLLGASLPIPVVSLPVSWLVFPTSLSLPNLHSELRDLPLPDCSLKLDGPWALQIPHGQSRTLDEGERGEWKLWLKIQHSKN